MSETYAGQSQSEQHQKQLKAQRYDLLMSTADGSEQVHRISIVWKDRLDGEREGAALMLNQDGLDTHKATLGWWAAMVRLELFTGEFWAFTNALIDVRPVKGDVDQLDPTQPAVPTGSA